MLQKLIKARKVNKKHSINILEEYTGIVSVGVGHKTISGEDTKEPCILIGVLDKGSFPKGEKIPSMIDGVKTDIVQEEMAVPMLDHKALRRPLVGGISIGPSNYTCAGTLGCCVYHNALGATKCGISNAHVLTYHAGVKPVITPDGYIYTLCDGDTVGSPVQPGKLDCDGAINQVGYNLPYKTTALNNGVDAAVFVVSGSGVSITPNSILGISTPNGLQYIQNNVSIGDPVIKSGRTTGVTTGTVTKLDASTLVSYPGCGSSSLIQYMTNLIQTTHILEPGDSGSILLKNTTTKPVLGLCFAGSSVNSYACEWGNVQNVMGIHL